MPNLADLLSRSAGEHPDRAAIKLDDSELSYAALDDGSARLAGLLRDKGIQPGDRVGIMLLVDELPKGPTGKILKREITPPLATASGIPASGQG